MFAAIRREAEEYWRRYCGAVICRDRGDGRLYWNRHSRNTLVTITGKALPGRRCLRDQLCSRLNGKRSTAMLASSFPSTAASLQSLRARMQVELMEAIAGARQTMARSRALLAEADAILAKERLPLIAPQLLASILAVEEIAP